MTPKILTPLSDEEMLPITKLVKKIEKHFEPSPARDEALQAVFEHIQENTLRDEAHMPLIGGNWNENGVKIAAFLTAFSKLAHRAAEKAGDTGAKTNSDIAVAMKRMVEYLDHDNVAIKDLSRLFKGYDTPDMDATRLRLKDTPSTKNPGYMHLEISGTTFLELVAKAGKNPEKDIQATHVEKATRQPRESQIG